MKHAETWEAGMANIEFKTITERKLSAKHYGPPRTPAGVSKEVPAPCRDALGTVTADGIDTGRTGRGSSAQPW